MKISWRGLPFLLLLLIAVFLGGCVSPDPDLTSGDQLLGAGNLRGAVDAFQRAYTKPQPEKEKAALAKRIEEIKRQITDSVLADARQATAQGANIPSLQQAAALLQRDVSYDDAARRLTTELTRASNRLDEMQAAYEAAVKEATAAERDDAWSRGVLALRKADLLNPSNEIKQRIESLINRRDKTVPARIEKLMDAQDLDAVQTEFEKYLAETPRPAGDAFSLLAAKVDFFRKKYLEARLDSLVQLNKYYTAFQLVRDSKRDYLDERMPEIRQQGAAFYKAKAAHEFDLGGSRLGYAFFAAEKAWELRPDDAAIFKLRREISDVVNAGITEQISIDVFTAKEKEDGIALSNTLMEHLLANRPYGIQILERAKIDELLKSQAAKRDLLLSKVKLWIVGDVTTLDVERQDSKREGTVEAKTGTRRVPNPEYANYLARYGKDQSKWPASLQSLTPENEEPIIQMITYKQGEVSLRGIMVTSVRTFESAGGEVIDARVFNATVSTNGVYRDEVRSAGITSLTLQLPTDNEVKETLRTRMASEIGSFALSKFEHREKRFFESARKSIERQEFDQAVANLAGGYFYGHNDKRKIPSPESDPTVGEIRQLGFFKYTE